MKQLEIQMFGDFSLRAGERSIGVFGNRVTKAWMLLAYLIIHREQVVSQKRLIDLIWGDTEDNTNPENTLRITLHRARGILDGLWENAGHDLIIYKDGGYSWNNEIPATIDFEQFEERFFATREGDGKNVDALLSVLELYQGDFLSKMSSVTWVIPISAHYHNMYITAVQEAADLLGEQGDHRLAADICMEAVRSEPYHEELHRMLIRALTACGDKKAAEEVYNNLSRRLFDDFGIYPEEETKQVFRNCVFSPENKVLPIEEVLESLQEPEYLQGALECDYDYFKVLCYAVNRSMERTGDVTHICLLSVLSATGKQLSEKSMERIIGQLGAKIRLNLRRGDAFARCTTSQYIIMLPKANYEDSCMVCRRVIAAFNRTHPGSGAKVQFIVQPLIPGGSTILK